MQEIVNLPTTEVTVAAVEIPVPVPVVQIVEVPVPVPVMSEERGEELSAWQTRVEQNVNALQEIMQKHTQGFLEAIQSQREIQSSNQTCLLRIETLLSSNQNPQNPVPPAVVIPPEPEVIIVAPETATVPPALEDENRERKTRKKVRKV